MDAQERRDEVTQLWEKVNADIKAGRSLVREDDDRPICQIHRLTCPPCLETEQRFSEAAQDISAWAKAIEGLSKQVPDSAGNCDTFLAAIAGLARAVKLTIQNDLVPELHEPETYDKFLEETRTAASLFSVPIGPKPVEDDGGNAS